jgi:hypothetical protein
MMWSRTLLLFIAVALVISSCDDDQAKDQVSGLIIDFADLVGVEPISKISYEFINGSEKIAAEITPSISSFAPFVLNEPALMGKTWNTTLLVWTLTEDCYQKVYRYKGIHTFGSGKVNLPSLSSNEWTPFFYTEQKVLNLGIYKNEDKYARIFRAIDPLHDYKVEVQLPEGLYAYLTYISKSYLDNERELICDEQYQERQISPSISGNIVFGLPNVPLCNMKTSLRYVDNFTMVFIAEGPNFFRAGAVFADYFTWEVSEGTVKPYCTK